MSAPLSARIPTIAAVFALLLPAGKVYLSPVIDYFDGMVVSWSIGTRPNAELVNAVLDAAVGKVTAGGDRPVVH